VTRLRDVRETVKVVKPPDYQERYREYLAASDEKPVLASALAPLLRAGTVLDVGAGTGDIPELLGVDPAAYTAVECLPDSVAQLRRKGYTVIEGLFPCPVGGPYATVLLSYCLYGPAQCEILIDAAWKAVAPGGRLIAITFRDHLDDYNGLLHRVGHTNRGGQDRHHTFLTDTFGSLGGAVTTYRWRSHLHSPDLAVLADLVSFMATNSNVGTLQRRAEIRAGIMAEQEYVEQYRTGDGGYRLPMYHHAFAVAKPDVSG
jgi:SAM-dependent methyltransferase